MGWTDGHVVCLELTLLRWRQNYARLAARSEEILTQLAADNVAAYFIDVFWYFQGYAALLQDRLDEAKVAYGRLVAAAEQSYFGVLAQEQTALLAGQIAMAEARWSAAETYLQRAVTLHRQTRHTVWLPHPRLVLARLYQQRKRPDRALDELKTVLAAVDRFGAPGILLQDGPALASLLRLAVERNLRRDLLEPLLAQFAQAAAPRPLAIPSSAESLSPREVEVLHLLATGASNRLIAEQLVITQRTVKAHVTNILAKLDVSSRGEAVARARTYHLI